MIVDDDGNEPIPPAEDDPASVLAHLVPAFWRTMRRGSQAAAQLPANESQVTILRMLDMHGSLTPTKLAEILGLALPTVSNQLRGLMSRGLIEREQSNASDRRIAVVSVTTEGRQVLESFRRDRTNLLRAAIIRLDDDDRQQVLSSMPALRHLLRQLEAVTAERQDNA